MSAAYQKMKAGAGNMKNTAGNVAGGAKSCLFDLTVYAGTILIALAYAELAQQIFLITLDEKDPEQIPLWLLWLYAGIAIIFAMVVCFLTGETISFGEDAC
eukprot:TRINITY_DN9231_c3_g1_i1.p2 TRINITY_DN9231_c3_g1~~TRINITY_DN9231_c3_g1_i1.p2  ORF type:complete len:101 (+),score=18.22 TRINITY_DN9231_c3_g1_i1:50-352(+)